MNLLDLGQVSFQLNDSHFLADRTTTHHDLGLRSTGLKFYSNVARVAVTDNVQFLERKKKIIVPYNECDDALVTKTYRQTNGLDTKC